MPNRPIVLSKTCPYCGARSKAEAKIPVPANLPAAEFNLDDLAGLVQKQSLSQLLALVELLPYKTFTCVKCGAEFRLESRSARDLVGSMLGSMQPAPPHLAPNVGPNVRPTAGKPLRTAPAPTPGNGQGNGHGKDWVAESLDAMLDYSADKKPER